MKLSTRTHAGRPLGKNSANTSEAKAFFASLERAGISLAEAHRKLKNCTEVTRAPSYRTLQEWRRGTNTPLFVPFSAWEQLLLTTNPGDMT